MRIVRVTNNGDTPFVGKFDGERFAIPPQSETLVPYGAMVLWMGDPAARNVDERHRHRVVENYRLHVKYGAYEDDDLYDINKPKLEAHTLEGELIPTVLTDPEGLLTEPDVSHSTDENAMRRELNDLRGQMGRIEEMLATGQLQVVPATADGTSPAPSSVPVALIDPTPEPEVPEIPISGNVIETIDPPTPTDAPTADRSTSSDTPPVDEPARVRVGNRSRAK